MNVNEPDLNVIKELIAEAFRINSARKQYSDSYLTEKSLQKMLYALRCELPTSNYVRNHLAYYWYKLGPYSGYVADAIDDMIRTDQLDIERRQYYNLLSLPKTTAKKRFWKHDRQFLQAASKLDGIVQSFQARGLKEEIKDQYWLQAPLNFYPQFRLNFEPRLRTFVSHVSENKPLSSHLLHELNQALQKLMISLPNVSTFSEFKRTYFDYATALTRLVDSTDRPKELAIVASRIADQMWETFAYGARLLAYDPPYATKLGNWGAQFQTHVAELARVVQSFYCQVIEHIGKNLGEEVISKELFETKMIELRRDGRLLWIRSEKLSGNLNSIDRLVGKDVANLPEFSYFMQGDALDFPVINKLDSEVFRQLLDVFVEPGRFYVAFTDSETGVKHLTFNVVSKSQSMSRTVTIQS